MILGRNTQIWLGAISGTLAFIQLMIVVLVPGIDPVVVATLIGGANVAIGGWIAVLANTSTTPVQDPQLKAGTMTRITDETGTVIGHAPVPDPRDEPANDDPLDDDEDAVPVE